MAKHMHSGGKGSTGIQRFKLREEKFDDIPEESNRRARRAAKAIKAKLKRKK